MAAGIFIPSPHYRRAILGSDAVRDGLEEIVDVIAGDYRDGVGVDEADLRDSIEGRVFRDDTGGYVGEISAEDWKARLHEFGTSRVKPTPALRNAISKSGLKLEVGAAGNRIVAR